MLSGINNIVNNNSSSISSSNNSSSSNNIHHHIPIHLWTVNGTMRKGSIHFLPCLTIFSDNASNNTTIIFMKLADVKDVKDLSSPINLTIEGKQLLVTNTFKPRVKSTFYKSSCLVPYKTVLAENPDAVLDNETIKTKLINGKFLFEIELEQGQCQDLEQLSCRLEHKIGSQTIIAYL